MQRPQERTNGCTDAGSHVGAGRSHYARRERGSIESVIDGGHQILLHGTGILLAGHGAAHHAQVISRVRQKRIGGDRLQALGNAVRRSQHGGRHGHHAQHILVAILLGQVVHRAHALDMPRALTTVRST